MKKYERHGAARVGAMLPEYRTWEKMKGRCANPNDRRYGGRGIRVCQRWKDSFSAFYADMGPRPTPRHSIDRINNDGNYEPSNCRWATYSEQARNTRRNRFVTIDDVTLTIGEWAERTGVHRNRIYTRINRDGWQPEAAIKTPFSSPPSAVGACKRGHRWTKDNWYVRPDTGARACLACARERAAKRNALAYDSCACGNRKAQKSAQCRRCWLGGKEAQP